LILAGGAVGVAVVAEGGSSAIDRQREDLADGFSQRANLARRERIGCSQGVNARQPQRLVGVQIADARDEGLVEQERLDAALARAQFLGERRSV